MAKVRIQKMLAAAGLASRRTVEEMVREGRITVNARTVEALPCFVQTGDEIRVDGQTVRKRPERPVYILLNKPRGVICTQRDETGRGRRRAVDLVGSAKGGRLHCVGRLDEETTGVIVLTNDGELTNRLTHPRYGVVKRYLAGVSGRVTAADVAKLKRGIVLEGRRASASGVRVLRRTADKSLLEVRISEGRNRQVRRMLAKLGHNVRRLHRAAIGPVTDRGLKIGHFRYLRPEEVSALRRAAGVAGERG